MSKQQATEALARQESHLVTLPEAHLAGAGAIQNLLESECGGVGVILSPSGMKRANHYHKTDWHYLYVFKGSFSYFCRPTGGKDVRRFTVDRGKMLFTPPMEDHALWFREDTVLISMSRLPRSHESHEADVVRLDEPLC